MATSSLVIAQLVWPLRDRRSIHLEVDYAEETANEAIPSRDLGAACWLTRVKPVAERDDEFLHHRPAVPYQTDAKYREYVEQVKATKQVYHLRSCQDIAQFYQTIAAQTAVTLPRS